MFNRSGLYNSKKFNIHKEPEQFIRIIAGYALITDAKLGLNTFVKHDGNSKYIVAQDVRISLEKQANRLDKSDSMPWNNMLSRKEEQLYRIEVCG